MKFHGAVFWVMAPYSDGRTPTFPSALLPKSFHGGS